MDARGMGAINAAEPLHFHLNGRIVQRRPIAFTTAVMKLRAPQELYIDQSTKDVVLSTAQVTDCFIDGTSPLIPRGTSK